LPLPLLPLLSPPTRVAMFTLQPNTGFVLSGIVVNCRFWDVCETCVLLSRNLIPASTSLLPISLVIQSVLSYTNGIDTGMRQEKDPSVDLYRGQPTNKPSAIAQAIAALAADETKNGYLVLMLGLTGRKRRCVCRRQVL
jgi:hypothetical protein